MRTRERTLQALLVLLVGCALLTGCSASAAALRPAPGTVAVADPGGRFSRNIGIVDTSAAIFSRLSGISVTVVSATRVTQPLCEFGQDVATGWGRTTGPFVVIVFASDPERSEVCLNRAARARLIGQDADLAAAVAVFDQLTAQDRWASAVTHLLKGLLPRSAGRLPFPNLTVEQSVPADRAALESEKWSVNVIVFGLPVAYLVAFCLWQFVSQRERRRKGNQARPSSSVAVDNQTPRTDAPSKEINEGTCHTCR